MDGALWEDVNGENWLFVRGLEMVSNEVPRQRFFFCLKSQESLFFPPEFGQGKSRGEGWKKWAQFMGKWPLQDVLLVSLDDHHIYLKFISGNKWFCAQDIVLLNCLFSKNAMHHPKVHFQYKCFLTRLLWNIGLANIMTPIKAFWIFLSISFESF